jgi:hypothetical protein
MRKKRNPMQSGASTTVLVVVVPDAGSSIRPIPEPWRSTVTRYSLLALTFVFLLAGSLVAQQSMSADEKQIRELIAAFQSGNALPAAKDRIFWSGAIKTPVVGSQQGEEVPSDRRPSLRVPGSQRNKVTIRRIEVAKSGDLAYEFSDSELSFDLKDGKRESFPTSALRVWKKEDGQWKVAAQFSRPHGE